MKVRIAVVQDRYDVGAVEENLAKMERAVAEDLVAEFRVKREGRANGEEPVVSSPDSPRVYVFPELCVPGYEATPQEMGELAEPRDGPSFRRVASMARRASAYVVYGYAERSEDGRIYNALQCVGPEGSSLGNYRKIHLAGAEGEVFTPGDGSVVFDTPMGRVGLMICWDLAFPELARTLALAGAEMIWAGSAWEKPYGGPFQRFAAARALDNTLFLAVSNQVGQPRTLDFCGDSAVYDPTGVSVTGLGEKPGLVAAWIDLADVDRHRSHFYTMLRERRPECYHEAVR
ncbi:carbon-nitrogen hydrolase family protein [Kyrpidia spormannii]|uniref:Carbon-nitrogen hydrolase family protein n=1 Tax=Kyrpidia spormannii TaxID=2055160 RepID=A0ACA8Z619_9BACL|nr:carbon-nitrogen hydrolase family protein [Kyrpidia spormannii]CAB3389469.1 Carbon-nitrogen hydrolase family protein [Kyrpidia spormannii]